MARLSLASRSGVAHPSVRRPRPAPGELGNLARCLAYHRACAEAGLTYGPAEWGAEAVAVHGLQETLKCLLML